jgi:hypothetical protein
MLNGEFVLDRVYGERRSAWQWEDSSVLQRAWEAKKGLFGTGFLCLETSEGLRKYRPISYQVRRANQDIIALWGMKIRPSTTDPPPLFEKSANRSNIRASRTRTK